MAHLAPSGKWDARFVRPCRRVTARPITLLTRCPSGILAPSPTMLATTPSACWVVLLRAVSPTLALRLWTSQNVTCRYVFVLSSSVLVFCPAILPPRLAPTPTLEVPSPYSVISLFLQSSLASKRASMNVSSLPPLAECFATRFTSLHLLEYFCVSSPFYLVKNRPVSVSSSRTLCAGVLLARDVSRTCATSCVGNVAASDGSGSQAPACRPARLCKKPLHETDANTLAPSR